MVWVGFDLLVVLCGYTTTLRGATKFRDLCNVARESFSGSHAPYTRRFISKNLGCPAGR